MNNTAQACNNDAYWTSKFRINSSKKSAAGKVQINTFT